jgi:DNA-binding transcriptional ArsR family regulator
MIERDESTIRRHLASLEEMGLIEVKKRKPLIVRATKLAKLVIS